MAHVAVTAVGADRPGIVAGVTGVLVESGCNLEDTSMTILRGHFAMMLIVSVPDGLSADELAERLAGVASELDLVISVRSLADHVPATAAGRPFVVSVYGADRPGIVHDVAALLAEHRVNICDLDTRVIGDPAHPVYAMVLDVAVPDDLPLATLEAALVEVAADLGVECSIHADDADIL